MTSSGIETAIFQLVALRLNYYATIFIFQYSRDNSVDTATRWTAGDRFLTRPRSFSPLLCVQYKLREVKRRGG
jgi:hypothetical protein